MYFEPEKSDTPATSIRYPKLEECIVIPIVDGLANTDYIEEIGKLTDPSDIHFVGRSGSSIYMFLSSKESVDKLTQKHETIRVKENMLTLTPRIQRFRRIILDVYPTVPHKIIEQVLQTIEIETKSNIKFLPIDTADPKFSHILSSYREVYVKQQDLGKLRNPLKFIWDGQIIWITITVNTDSYIALNECSTNESREIAAPLLVSNSPSPTLEIHDFKTEIKLEPGSPPKPHKSKSKKSRKE